MSRTHLKRGWRVKPPPTNRGTKRRGDEPVTCPYCERRAPRPKPFPDHEEITGGRCDCGVVWIADLTGKTGGQCLVDGLTLLADGDVSAAMSLEVGRDYELTEMNYRPKTHSAIAKRPGRGRNFGLAKLWFFRRLPVEGDPA